MERAGSTSSWDIRPSSTEWPSNCKDAACCVRLTLDPMRTQQAASLQGYPIRVDLRDAVLARVDLVELIGQYTALTHSRREWRGRCVFHSEKTASFYVN